MWSNWIEDAKKKAGEAFKATSQIMSDVFTDCFYHPDRVYKLRRRRLKRVRIGKKDDL